MALAISHLLLRFGGYALCSSRLSAEAREGISPLLLKLTFGQLRPKAPPLDFASWAQLDQLMSAASLPKTFSDSAISKN
ncbi:MAG: hypothetical protein HDT21_08115 [Ruminococcus sp.]|nr:hypothetical protein [Ruminococcus sp.]